MSAPQIIWHGGEPSVHARIDEALEIGLDSAALLHQSDRRTLHRIDEANGCGRTLAAPTLVLKTHRTSSGRHRLREFAKRLLGRSPAYREWKMLGTLYEAGVPVPCPRAWGRLTSGDEVVVTDYFDGEPLAMRLKGASRQTHKETVHALADSIDKLHREGFCHGDLHLGNLWASGKEIKLLDVQRARPRRRDEDLLWDVAQLELSLARNGWDPAMRMALRVRLGVGEQFDPILRRFLRDYQRGRARRVLRVGRDWSIARVGRLRGLRDQALDDATLALALNARASTGRSKSRRAGRATIREFRARDRSIIVKHIKAGHLRRALGDRLRGSPAARGFRAGQRAGLFSKHAARPFAFLEERRLGLPTQSWLFLEKVGDQDLDAFAPKSPEEEHRLALALGPWLADGHAWGLSHRDLKAGNLRVSVRDDSIRFWMVDLEDLASVVTLSEDDRLHALSQLNASLSDEALGVDARRAALEVYTERIPFGVDCRQVAREIAERSLARRHVWRGDDCDCRADRGEPSAAIRPSP